MRWKPWAQRGACMILGTVYAYAGWTKIGQALPFADSIASFDLLPRGGIMPLALGLPVLEIVVGALLILGIRAVRQALFAALMMALCFSVVLGSARARGLDVDCGCFGAQTSSSGWVPLARALFLFATALLLYRVWLREGAKHGLE